MAADTSPKGSFQHLENVARRGRLAYRIATAVGGTRMFYHHPQNQERALNLSILIVSGPGEFPRVESN